MMDVSKRSQQKIDSILINSKHLFNEYGFNKVTMDNIAQVANVSKGTLYKYFPDKQYLYEYLVKQIYDTERAMFRGIIEEEGEFLTKIRSIIEERVKKYTETHKKFFQDFFNRSKDLDQYMHEYIEEIANLRKKLYAEGKSQGFISEKLSEDSLELYFEIIQIGLSNKYHDLSEMPKDQLTSVLNLIYSGMVSNCIETK